MSTLENLWEKRWNPLRGEWVVYAAHRDSRPWDGESLVPKPNPIPYVHDCYLCPGNTRSIGVTNPKYKDIFVFDNDFPVVSHKAPTVNPGKDPWSLKGKASGFAKVICYHPDHSKTMSNLDLDHLSKILSTWKDITKEGQNKGLKSVLIFENKGSATGVSNLHPHCQAYATDFIFKHTSDELNNINQSEEDLFQKIIDQEKNDELRLITQNEHAIAFIPFFAKYAFEVMIFPKRKVAQLTALNHEELDGIARVYQEVIQKYDALYQMDFPYVMSIMQAPFEVDHEKYHMYFHFQPPLRTPAVKKYLAGPEIGGGNFMADTMPEVSAKILRNAAT